jgi:hypothetical protein
MDQFDPTHDSRSLLVRSLWFVAAAMALHELEEWNIAEWGARNFDNHTGISDYAIWLGLVIITGLFVGWIYAATRLGSPLAISIVALPAVALVAVGNSVQHVTWTIAFAEYAPGVVSAVLLVLPASLLAMWQMVRIERLLLLPIGVCALLWVMAVNQVIETGRTLQPFQLVLHHLLIGLATELGLPGVNAT